MQPGWVRVQGRRAPRPLPLLHGAVLSGGTSKQARGVQHKTGSSRRRGPCALVAPPLRPPTHPPTQPWQQPAASPRPIQLLHHHGWHRIATA